MVCVFGGFVFCFSSSLSLIISLNVCSEGKNKGKALAKKVKKSVTRTEDSDDEIEDRELCCICNRFQPDGLRLDMAKGSDCSVFRSIVCVFGGFVFCFSSSLSLIISLNVCSVIAAPKGGTNVFLFFFSGSSVPFLTCSNVFTFS
jgi:hypothetical protein